MTNSLPDIYLQVHMPEKTFLKDLMTCGWSTVSLTSTLKKEQPLFRTDLITEPLLMKTNAKPFLQQRECIKTNHYSSPNQWLATISITSHFHQNTSFLSLCKHSSRRSDEQYKYSSFNICDWTKTSMFLFVVSEQISIFDLRCLAKGTCDRSWK